MENVIEYNYRLHISLLSPLGLWPYTNTSFRLIRNIFCETFFVIGIISQLTAIVTSRCSTSVLLYNAYFIIQSLQCMLKYSTYWYHSKDTKNLMEQVKYDWNILKDVDELQIFVLHANIGQFYTKVFALIIYPSACALITSPFTPTLLDILVPLNESRPHQLPIMMEIFVDQEKYFYFCSLLVGGVIFLNLTAVIATESIFFMWIHHISAILEVVSYRIKHAINAYSTGRPTNEWLKKKSDKNLGGAVDLHVQASKFSHDLKAAFSLSYMTLIVLAVMSLSILLFRLSQSFLVQNDTKDLILCGVFLSSHLTYMYFVNYVAQELIDSCNNILYQLYNTSWYEAPLPTQKKILFIMSRSLKFNALDWGILILPSLQSFCQLAKSSMSYFMAILSCQ